MLGPSLLTLVESIPSCRIVEIGVARGETAEQITSLQNVVRYFGVDPYVLYDAPPDATFEDGYLDLKMVKIPQNEGDIEVLMRECHERLKPYEDKVTMVREYSHLAANQIPDGVDVIYVDGNHQYDYVMVDMRTFFPKLRPGGLLIGDDYHFSGGPQTGAYGGIKASEVARACRDFCEEMKLEHYVVDSSFVIVRPYDELMEKSTWESNQNEEVGEAKAEPALETKPSFLRRIFGGTD